MNNRKCNGCDRLFNVTLFTDNGDYSEYFEDKLDIWLRDTNKSISGLHETLKYFAYWRKKFAEMKAHPKFADFGKPREGDRYTAIVDKYSVYGTRAMEYLEGENQGMFEDSGIPLTRISLSEKDKNILCWFHTSPLHIKYCINKMEVAWDSVGQLNNIGAKIEAVAEFHWWGSHAMPYCRGSAGVIDAAAKHLQISNGIQPTPWKRNVSPDCDALVLDKARFMMLYPSLSED